MNNTIIFLRHGKTVFDTSILMRDWILTEDAQRYAENVAKDKIFDNVDVIYASIEKKAVQTAQPIADRLGIEIVKVSGLCEIDRPNGHIISPEEYRRMKIKIFEDFDFTDHGWETCNHALNRFKAAVEKIDGEHEGKKILIAAHGTVMTLYFAHLQGLLSDIFSRWKGLGFCDWGIVKNGKIIKDIA